jgi:quercetin dioxygenase-like cupin family protein
MRWRLAVMITALVVMELGTAPAFAQPGGVGIAGAGSLVIKPLAAKKVATLPAGPLFWRVESFPGLAQAEAAAGPTGLVAQSGGQVWLLTLGPAGGSSDGGTKIAEIGPLPPLAAAPYLLRVNEASGPAGSVTPVHSHPGIEATYVLAGEQTFRTPDGVTRVGAGHGAAGHAAGAPMQVSSSGSADLRALVMFVVDSTKPFSIRAKLP